MAAPFAYRPLAVRLRTGSPFTRTLFIKQSTASTSDAAPDGRALFVAGIPRQLEQEHLQSIFELFGEVQKVVLHPKHTSGIIVYSSEESIPSALAAAKQGKVIDYDVPLQASTSGLRALMEAHKAKYPGNQALQEQLNKWMHDFDQEEAQKAAEAENADDGWTVVTNKAGRKRAKGNTVSGGVAQQVAQEHLARKKARVQDDFYRFQARAKQQSELVELQKSFAEAQKQVASMRSTRKL